MTLLSPRLAICGFRSVQKLSLRLMSEEIDSRGRSREHPLSSLSSNRLAEPVIDVGDFASAAGPGRGADHEDNSHGSIRRMKSPSIFGGQRPPTRLKSG